MNTKTEFNAYFKTPAAYVYGALILVICGIYAIHYNLTGGLSNFEYAVNDAAYVLVILSPLLTYFLHHRLYRPKDESSLKERVLSTGPVLVMLNLLPSLLLLLYPLILTGYGKVYLPSAFSEITAFFFLSLVSSFTCLLCALCAKKALLAALASLGAHLIAYLMTPLAGYLATPYASMLGFTLVIGLLGFAVYRVTRHSTLTLLIIVLLEVVQVIFFVTKQASFTYLAEAIFSLLSPFGRFRMSVGGVLDLPGLLYMASLSFVLFIASAMAAPLHMIPSADEKEKEEEAPSAPATGHDEASSDKPLFNPLPFAIAVAGCLILNLAIWFGTKGALILDTSETKLFTPSETLTQEIRKVNTPVTVHFLVQVGAEDDSLRTALYKYSAMNPRLKVRRLNPDISQDFISANTIEDIYNNGLLVISGDRSRYINYSDLYGYDYSRYDQIGTYDLTFRLEDLLDHALEFVQGSELNKIYATTGHDEGTLPEYYNALFQKEDAQIFSFSLKDGIPEDADGILILGPSKDFTEEEANLLSEYLSKGGRLLLVTRLHVDGATTPVLESVMLEYGAVLIPGVVIESGSEAYNTNKPYIIRPSVLNHPVNEDMISARKAPIFEVAQGIILMPVSGVTQTPLLVTSEQSFVKLAGYQSTTYEMEEGDVEGIQNVAVAFEGENGSRVVWITSGSVVEMAQNTESSGGNQYFFLGSLKWAVPSASHITIPAKMYNYGVLRITGDAVSRVGMLLVFLLPFLYLSVGFIFLGMKKRKEFLAKEALQEEELRREEEEKRLQEEEEQRRKEAFRKAREEAAKAAKESAKEAARKAKK